jgi:Xaa-Pro aminopeptidase
MKSSVGGGDNRSKVKKLADVVDELRLMKSADELNVMRQAGRITGRAFVEVKTKKQNKNRLIYHHLIFGKLTRPNDM